MPSWSRIRLIATQITKAATGAAKWDRLEEEVLVQVHECPHLLLVLFSTALGGRGAFSGWRSEWLKNLPQCHETAVFAQK